MNSPEIQSIIATYRDITEPEELEQRKDEFIAMASHELKTPLTSLKGYTQVLKMDLESMGLHQMIEDLSVMEHQIDTLIRLIGDFLDVSRIKAGKLADQYEAFELDPFVQEMRKILQRISPHHTLTLTGEAHCSLVGDKERLGQALINLVNNAIKYSPNRCAFLPRRIRMVILSFKISFSGKIQCCIRLLPCVFCHMHIVIFDLA